MYKYNNIKGRVMHKIQVNRRFIKDLNLEKKKYKYSMPQIQTQVL
jgi:hypothetical protein